MRPFVFMFAVIFVFGSQDPVPKKHTETAHPDQHSQKAADYSKPGAQIVYVEGPSPNSDTDGQAKAGTSNNPSQHWWYRPTATDWILSFLTLAYVIINVFMLIAIKRQAHLAERSMNALMNAEQAVLKIYRIEIRSFTPKWFEYRVSNIGKTVATVFAHHGKMQIGNSKDSPPDESGYSYNPVQHNTFEYIVELDSAENVGHVVNEKEADPLTKIEQKEITDGTMFLWVCGFYRYRDIFGREFTQKYCYLWDERASSFKNGGPAKNRRLI